jgi:predicted RNase H-like HicB family nuclease
VVTFPDFPGCITQGDTLEEAKTNAVEVLELWIEELKSSGEVVPAHPQESIISKVQVAV